MHRATLLVVDDEPNITFSLQQSLATEELRVITAATAREAIEAVRVHRPYVVLLDVRLPDMSGLDAYNKIREIDPRLPVVIMTAFARTETAIEATRRGAFDYLIKPVDLGRLRQVIAKALQVSRLGRVPAVLTEEEETLGGGADLIVGLSPAMQEVYKSIGRIAGQEATVLILGESGTGKELVARAIFHYSQRSSKPFLAINCAALPEALLESELFGHERGAFTGAEHRRIGKFEQMNGGTIFLDEIGDMSPATQAKALRLLQQQQFECLGGNETIQTDVRVIAATNRDIATMVEEGKFRRDLFYRLNGYTIQLPPLRDRREDIPPLVRHFMRTLTAATGQAIHSITPDALEQLQSHDWPGNVREFESAIRFAVIHATSDVVTRDCLPESCRSRLKPSVGLLSSSLAETLDTEFAGSSPVASSEHRTESSDALPNDAATLDVSLLAQQLLNEGTTNLYRQVGNTVDKIVLSLVMKHVDGNQQQAAELLGLSRMTLRNKLRALSTVDDEPTADEEPPSEG